MFRVRSLLVISLAFRIGRVSFGMSLVILTGSGPRWQTLVLPQLHHGFRRVGASPLPLGCSSVWPRL